MPDRAAQDAVDPDLDLHVVPTGRAGRSRRWGVALAVAAGGALGAAGRHAVSVALPQHPGAFPWATLAVNVSGCLAIGVLMVVLTEVARRPPWVLRPLLGVGFLGGFTTFSTYTVETRQLLDAGLPRAGVGYLFATLAAALVAAQVGIVVTRFVAARRHRTKDGGDRS